MTTSISTDLHPHANLARRLAAMVYDAFLLLAIWFLLGAIVVSVNGGEAPDNTFLQRVMLPLLIAASWGFYTWFWTHGGQTLGMRAWRLKVVDDQYQDLNSLKSLNRCAWASLGLLIAGIGYWWIFLDGGRCALHDRLSNSRVVVLPKEKK